MWSGVQFLSLGNGGMWASRPTGFTQGSLARRRDVGIPPYGGDSQTYGGGGVRNYRTNPIRIFKTRRQKTSPFLSDWFSGIGRHIIRKETQNLCPLNLWGQRFVDLHRVVMGQRRLAAIQFSGSFTVKRQPRPGRFSCAISPPQTFRMRLTSASPRPLPSSRWELSP